MDLKFPNSHQRDRPGAANAMSSLVKSPDPSHRDPPPPGPPSAPRCHLYGFWAVTRINKSFYGGFGL